MSHGKPLSLQAARVAPPERGIHAVSDPARRLTLHRRMVAALGALFAGAAAAAPSGARAPAAFERQSGLVTTSGRDGRAVAYWGADGRCEHLFKFVADGSRLEPGARGRLLAARFERGGRGHWLPVEAAGTWPLADATHAVRAPADATAIGQRHWMAVDAVRGEIYCPLRPGPETRGRHSDLIKWRESGGLPGDRFDWSHFLIQAGPDDTPDAGLWAAEPSSHPDRRHTP